MPNKPGNDDRISGASSSNDASRSNSNGDTGMSGSGSNGSSRSNRGFASMDRGKQREIASKGGRAAHAKGTAHEFDSGEAREAGRKGGVAVSRNREHMAAIGRRGGEARGHARARAGVGAQTNTGSSSSEGSFQNSRAASDRQVNLPSQNDGASNSSQRGTGSSSSNSSMHQDRRGESFGNR